MLVKIGYAMYFFNKQNVLLSILSLCALWNIRAMEVEKTRDEPMTLVEALKSRNLSKAQFFLQQSADINTPDEQGQTPLMLAAQWGEDSLVKSLIAQGAHVNDKDMCKASALLKAAEQGHKDIVEVLIAHDAEINTQDMWGNTALLLATKNDCESVVTTLLQAGANSTIKNALGHTALLEAIIRKRNNIRRRIKGGTLGELLIAHGANVNAQDNKGRSALMVSSQDNDVKLVIKLLNAGASLSLQDNEQRDVFFYACHNALITRLLTSWVHKEHPEKVLMHIAQEGNYQQVLQLIQAGVSIRELIHSEEGLKALFAATTYNNRFHLGQLLINAGFSAEDLYEFARIHNYTEILPSVTPPFSHEKWGYLTRLPQELRYELSYYLQPPSYRITQINQKYLQAALDVISLVIHSKQYALFNAILAGNQEALNTSAQFFELLTYAALLGNHDAVKLLLKRTNNLDAATNSILTPLIAASAEGHSDIVKTLIDAGADVNVGNYQGNTAFTYATEFGHTTCINLLKAHIIDNNHHTTSALPPLLSISELIKTPGFLQYVEHLEIYLNIDKSFERTKRTAEGAQKGVNTLLKREAISKQTVLMWACMFGHTQIVQSLLKRGVPQWYINAQDKYGRTALMYAILFGRADIVKELLPYCGNGANLKDFTYNSALIYAIRTENMRIIEELLRGRVKVSVQALKLAAQMENNIATILVFRHLGLPRIFF